MVNFVFIVLLDLFYIALLLWFSEMEWYINYTILLVVDCTLLVEFVIWLQSSSENLFYFWMVWCICMIYVKMGKPIELERYVP